MKKKYSYLNNLKFVFFQHWQYNRNYIFALMGDVPINVLISLVAAFLPKIVLDCVEKSSSPKILFIQVGLASSMLVFLKIVEKAFLVYEENCVVMARYDLFQRKLFCKLIDMDYNNFVFSETRLCKEKANRAIRGNTHGIVPYLSINKKLYTSIFGFFTFSAIIAKCNIWFIPILIGTYILSCLGWLILQKYNNSIKNKRAKVFLQLNYVTFRSKNFSDAKDIRIYNMIDFLMKRINKHLEENTRFDVQKNNGHYVNVLFEDFLKFAVTFITYLYLINLKIETSMSIGDFALYFGAITGFGSWLSKIVDSISCLIESNHYVNDYRNFLNIPDKMNIKKEHKISQVQEQPCSIEVKKLSFTYEQATKPTIDNFSLTIAPGEKIAIVGANGAGKSTLVKLICGLFLPNKGSININGKDSSLYNRDDYYKLFATVFQDTPILPASIAKNISLCDELEIDREKLYKVIQLAGLENKIQSLPQKENTLLVPGVNAGAISLSGGELQRLLLARSLYKDAPIMILDEPTASLDPIAEKELYLKYNELTYNKTSIYISHRLSSTKFCDKIILIDNASVVEIGTHEELLRKGGLYAKMFETQSKYYKGEGYFE